MGYNDLRKWLQAVESHGELKHIAGANSNLEMSGIAEIVYREGKKPKPALLFEDIPGYQKGYRTLFGLLASAWQIAVTLGLPEDQLHDSQLATNWLKKMKELRPIPPKYVTTGPLEENVDVGDKVDLFKIPSPRFHEFDTEHRYIGTACAVIQKDPDTGWVNLGTYRAMVIDKNRVTFHAVAGQHGSMIMDKKYFARHQVMPVAIAFGIPPALYWSSVEKVPWGMSEYDHAGGIIGEPIEVIKSPYTGLPLPARAEIVIEGECHPEETAEEGPFGEWHGYYANLGLVTVPEPVVRIKAVHYRNDPILTCAQETTPPHDDTLVHAVSRSAVLWNELESLGLPGIKAVWCHELGNGGLFNVISLHNMYAGHSQAVGTIASQIPVLGRYTIVVEDDVDPSNLEQVLWAVVTRSLPDRAIQIINNCRSGSHDPAVPAEEKLKYKVPPKPLSASRCIIDACRDLKQKPLWYPMAVINPEYRTKILQKWGSTVTDLLPD